MKLLLVVVLLAGCSINHRSDQFACENASQCDPGQSCTDGFCIGGTTPPTDGPDIPDPDGPVPPDTFVCPAQCTSCNSQTNTCTVDCNISPATCLAAINCPPGFNCNIQCTRNDSCANINCTQGESCTINCKGNGTCKTITCGEGKCDVTCVGNLSCRNVNCADSCACDLDCQQNSSCVNTQCPESTSGNEPFGCSDFRPNVCTSEPDGCNTCM